MKVILRENVKNLGNIGEIHNVSDGYARNYLLPKQFAAVANEANKKILEDQKRALAKKIAVQRDSALAEKKKVEAISLTFEKRIGGNGKLFGTVTNSDLANELAKQGMAVDRKVITTDRPVKALGEYEVKVKLFTDVEAVLPLKVVMDEKQKEEIKAAEAKAKKDKKVRAEKKEASAEEAAADTATDAAEAPTAE